MVQFLSSPASYPEDTTTVSVIQTHHAWVFLTDRHAYKMKKPFRHGRREFSSLESRRNLCNEEVRLNRQLSPLTYLGVLPMVIDGAGQLRLGDGGRVVEWLVKMRRLPSEQMLHEAAQAGRVRREDIDRLMRKLLRFFDAAPACRVGQGSYASRIRREVSSVASELLQAGFDFPTELVRDTVDGLDAYIDANETLIEQRQLQGRVREIHGDLRPEHVCLVPDDEPEIVDRLEFDPDLRCLDCVEELAYFGLECRVIGQRWIEEACIDWYRSNGGDTAPTHLWRFYAARRAMVRAMLSAWHTLDSEAAGWWLGRGTEYLSLASDYLLGGSSDPRS